ncbi:MAG: hypothetical protein ACFE8B_11010 [Candidatus Hermodarchaeota archaeon]
MNDVKNIHNGILATTLAGIFCIMMIVIFFLMGIEFFFIMVLLPMILCMFIPGFYFLYKGFPLKYRGLLLLISFILSVIPSIMVIITLNDEFFTMFHTYIIVFFALIFIVPAIFHFYLEFFKEDVPKVKKILMYIAYYVCMMGLAFFVSFILFGLGFAPQDYINEKFWSMISIGVIVGVLGTGVIVFYILISRSGKLGTFLTQLLTAIFGMIVAAIAVMLSFYLILG